MHWSLARGDAQFRSCFVGDFAAVNGVQPRTWYWTPSTVVRGEGTIDLREERLALRLIAQPKDGSLLALRGPVRVDGTLAVRRCTRTSAMRWSAVALRWRWQPSRACSAAALGADGREGSMDCEPLSSMPRFIRATNRRPLRGAAGEGRDAADDVVRRQDCAAETFRATFLP
jgi:hypothetical protein